jgi:predicted naringenin-chalcone synthase
LRWLAAAHATSAAMRGDLDSEARQVFEARMTRVLERCAARPDKIARRGVSLPDVESTRWNEHALYDLDTHPHGRGSGARTQIFADLVDRYFDDTYATEDVGPDDLIHVTCTGYVSPSGAQKVAARRGWGATTRVTHAYQMGCYAAVPAVRIAASYLSAAAPQPWRCDIVHTELCSLHFDPTNHSIEQLVVQSLFADGLIRYSMVADNGAPGLRLRALHEVLLPDSADAMTWAVSDWGMQMTLARDVPDRISGSLRGFVGELFDRAGLGIERLKGCVAAVHPGGPKIIDRVREVLELDPTQVATSRQVLFDHGNMSSATLPHIWMRIIDDPAVPRGTLIPSFAFGPGLTVCGALFEKQ